MHDKVASLERGDEVESETLHRPLLRFLAKREDFTIGDERALEIRILKRVWEEGLDLCRNNRNVTNSPFRCFDE